MVPIRTTLTGSVAQLLVCFGLLAQEPIELAFFNHNGATVDPRAIPALETGDLIGLATVAGGPAKAFVRWAYYLNGGILDDGSSSLSYAHPVPILDQNAGHGVASYQLRLPVGYGDGSVSPSLLPVAELVLRVWLTGAFDPAEANPPTRPLAMFEMPVACLAPDVALYIPSSRNLEAGSATPAWVLLDQPARVDEYFQLRCEGEYKVEQHLVLIPAGSTASSRLVVAVGDDPGAGRIIATRMRDAAVFRSAAMLSHRPTASVPENPGAGRLEDFRYCKSPTTGDTSGDTDICGQCAMVGGTPVLPPACGMYNGQEGVPLPVCHRYHCAPYSGTKCRIFAVTLPLKHWELVGPYRTETCFEVRDAKGGGGTTIEVPEVIKFSANSNSSVTITGKSEKRCCTRRFAGIHNVQTATCETVFQ